MCAARRKRILLIHGWDWRNYTSLCKATAWDNRKELVADLRYNFIVDAPNLPGFCGEPEPDIPYWTLADYARFIQDHIVQSGNSYDIVLGYSFGAAVALNWKVQFPSSSSLILVSPALIRQYAHRSFLTDNRYVDRLAGILPSFAISSARHIYLKYLVKNPFYSKATKFMRETYRHIVRVDCSALLNIIPSNDVTIIFGENDSATPPSLLISSLTSTALRDRIRIIPGGGHNIGATHYKDIAQHIV